MATSKYSHQREAIINFLTGRTDHPTADVVYQYLRNDLPTISLGTVYRNLNQMAASGRILRLHVDGKTDHYDACTDPHAHLLCTKCGAAMYDLRAKARLDSYHPDIFVCGHTHIPQVFRDKRNGFLFMNPGACGFQGSGDVPRLALRFHIVSGEISGLEKCELPRRSI